MDHIWVFLNSTFLQSLSILVSVAVGFIGLRTWKEQHTWTRNSELAEELLVAARGFQDAIRRIRSPLSFDGEGRSRSSKGGETQSESQNLDFHFIPLERFRSEVEAISRLHAADVRSRIRFGECVTKSLDILSAAHRTVFVAARLRFQTAMSVGRQTLGEEVAEIQKKHESIIWSGSEDDPIDKQIEDAVRELQSNLECYLT